MKASHVSKFVVYSLDFETPQHLSAAKLLNHLSDSSKWPEASIHPAAEQQQYPFLNIEFHARVGFSVLCFDKPSSLGHLAATSLSLSKPQVLVCLGGQVIERWPRELFLPVANAKRVVSHFLKAGERLPAAHWVRLDRFERETVH